MWRMKLTEQQVKVLQATLRYHPACWAVAPLLYVIKPHWEPMVTPLGFRMYLAGRRRIVRVSPRITGGVRLRYLRASGQQENHLADQR